ncbi:hypothetical protein GGI59_006525 [Rhizobium lentis]|uniref:Uncharacterized protein n=1 Tax=Rhizobium lentis TaxID=1138194 RepID=A0A7W8XL94_9HYPH|nr:hypothetical protein [Rhizobium lentis]MBB5554193.1 hypothetical protein [Rhizobium lentis]MBB5564814.1 hypothetical protein [Rhizobium lentis]MBB5571302.1 hypothetical protein [Rhizobium lentis]
MGRRGNGGRQGYRQEAQRYSLAIAGFATELTPRSVVLGLDPRTHAGLAERGHGFQAQSLE